MSKIRKALIILGLPIIIGLWMLGWTLYYFGDKARRRT